MASSGSRALLLLPALVLGAAAGLTGCGDDAGSPRTAGPSTSGAPTSEAPAPACSDGIPASVLAGLGWDDSVEATEDRGGCLWEGEQGSIWVVAREDSYDDLCEELADTAPGGTFEDEVPNDAGVAACGYLRDDEVGPSEIAVDEGDRVMTVNLLAVQPTPPDAVREALSALAASTPAVP